MLNNSYKICLNFYEIFTNYSFNKELRYIDFSILLSIYAIFYSRWNGQEKWFSDDKITSCNLYIYN